jgi:hypothetical protein
MKVGEMPIIVLARAGATITEGPIAQSISAMNLNA